ncbi:MAG TPA: MobA/MobL family protein [Steroidobacteraceae bacterium]|nr:MobA/MobL family protein [Steroidobacteraceae bacterium]
MASYFLRAKHISRGKGARVTRAAAYRAGERIRDERTGETYDHSDRQDVVYKEVVLPADLAGRGDMAWTQDRATLWNAAEHAGRRCNSRLAREFLVLLPPELTPAQRVDLVRGFSQELADRNRCAVDTALHAPRPGADRRNHHAHLLMTVREVTPGGMGPRTALELGGRERHLRDLGPTREDYLAIRARWAELSNQALQRAGLAARVDHRSFKAQGLDREPTPSIPEKVFYAERSGAGSAAGDAIRERHRERLEARAKGDGELERVVQRQKRELRERAIEDLERRKSGEKKARWASLTREERNALRRQQYRARREREKQDPDAEARRREASRQRYHAGFRDNPEAVRQRRRRYRNTHAEEMNRKQREYRKAHAEELNRRRREHRQAERSAELAPSPVRALVAPADSARTWRAHREGKGEERTAEQSAAAWKSNDARQPGGPTAEEAARSWLARRRGRGSLERDPNADEPSSRSSQSGTAREVDDDDARNVGRRRDHDFDF